MKKDKIIENANGVLSMIDASLLPDVHKLLSEALDAEDGFDDMYNLACGLIECDDKAIFPSVLIELITSMFEYDIERGKHQAMNDLGVLYYSGRHGFEQSYEKAFFYYNIAAQNGSRIAQENLGYCYYYGRDVEVNYEKAYHYYALGALMGSPISLYKMGDMYSNGYYVQKNERQAFDTWFHALQIMDDNSAKYAAGPIYLRLGKALLYGNGTEKDVKNALVCLRKAEQYLYDMVDAGDRQYYSSLKKAIQLQNEARDILLDQLN